MPSRLPNLARGRRISQRDIFQHPAPEPSPELQESPSPARSRTLSCSPPLPPSPTPNHQTPGDMPSGGSPSPRWRPYPSQRNRLQALIKSAEVTPTTPTATVPPSKPSNVGPNASTMDRIYNSTQGLFSEQTQPSQSSEYPGKAYTAVEKGKGKAVAERVGGSAETGSVMGEQVSQSEQYKKVEQNLEIKIRAPTLFKEAPAVPVSQATPKAFKPFQINVCVACGVGLLHSSDICLSCAGSVGEGPSVAQTAPEIVKPFKFNTCVACAAELDPLNPSDLCMPCVAGVGEESYGIGGYVASGPFVAQEPIYRHDQEFDAITGLTAEDLVGLVEPKPYTTPTELIKILAKTNRVAVEAPPARPHTNSVVEAMGTSSSQVEGLGHDSDGDVTVGLEELGHMYDELNEQDVELLEMLKKEGLWDQLMGLPQERHPSVQVEQHESTVPGSFGASFRPAPNRPGSACFFDSAIDLSGDHALDKVFGVPSEGFKNQECYRSVQKNRADKNN